MLQLAQFERHVLAYIAAGAEIDWEKERAGFDSSLNASPSADSQSRFIRELGLVA